MGERWPETLALQERFATALLHGGRAAEILPAMAGSLESSRERLAIYRANMRANWTKALAGAYPVIAQVVGEDFFGGLAREYGRGRPSRCGDLNEFGGEFPQFLADFEPVRRLPYLPDLGRLEWLVHRANYAADTKPLDLQSLASVSESRYTDLGFTLGPGASVLASAWPVARIWNSHQPGYLDLFDVDLDAGPDRVLVHRRLYNVEVCSVGLGDFAFLSRCAELETLQVACSAALQAESRFRLDAALARWATLGVITGIRFGSAGGKSG